MMKKDAFWKKFESTGRISDYLEYACTLEEDTDNLVIGDPIPEQQNIILPGYDERYRIY